MTALIELIPEWSIPVRNVGTLAVRFEEKVIREGDGCWRWAGAYNGNGYGMIGLTRKRPILAHRISFCLANDLSLAEIHGAVVRHNCDNPACVNPKHLCCGTQKQNIRDMVDRGRALIGSKNPYAKLSESDVVVVKKKLLLGKTHREIAQDFGVSRCAITDIASGKNWSHVRV